MKHMFNSLPMDFFRLGVMQSELFWSSMSTISYRQQSWFTTAPLSTESLVENQRMVWEKIQAGLEMQQQWQRLFWSTPWTSSTSLNWSDVISSQEKLIKPFHKRSTANAKRLRRKSQI